MSEKEIIEIGEVEETGEVEVPKNNFKAWIITAVIIGLIGLIGLGLILRKSFSGEKTNAESAEKTEEHSNEEGKEVKLDQEMLNSAGLKYEGVTSQTAVSLLRTTGTIEANPQQMQQITSLVSGKVERVAVSIGDRVSNGDVLATVISTEIAENYGKWREAETKVNLAEKNLARVKQAESQVTVLQAKAKFDEASSNLDRTKDLVKLNSSKDLITAESSFTAAKAKFSEAEATLKRTKKLIELGAGAGKDLKSAQTGFETAKAELDVAENNVDKVRDFIKIGSGRDVLAAETEYKTAKAEYNFQKNISLSKNLQDAEGELKLAQVDANHLKESLLALGVNVRDISVNVSKIAAVPLRSSFSGIVTERMINNGSGVQAGQNLLTLSDVSSVWATANVPQDQMKSIFVGTSAEIKLADGKTINARVSYIEPTLNEDTRTGKVRLAIDNPDSRMKVGMFVEIGFQTGKGDGTELAVPTEAIQNVEGKNIVFIPVKDEPGAFAIREVEIGGEADGYTRIKEGVELGEMVVTKGSFTLKTVMQKGEMGEHGH
jgi:membrane fusion protein, heavy metal efflux system